MMPGRVLEPEDPSQTRVDIDLGDSFPFPLFPTLFPNISKVIELGLGSDFSPPTSWVMRVILGGKGTAAGPGRGLKGLAGCL